ncbi:UNVERIFIED_CONTAM: hypothetical protein PYX00_006744 [Menopon gallinae]|uniref:Uncharacterized protein n=1 Tax=Menopon gallinae TaxID=328185 RepID=A0AAW2HY17_9NEOP
MHSLFPLSGLGDLRRLNDLRRTIFSNSRKDSEDNFITPRGAYHLINRVLQNNTITGPTTGTTGSTTSLPRWRQDVGKNPFSIFNVSSIPLLLIIARDYL